MIRANIPPTFPYLKLFQAMDPLFVTITKPLSNMIREALYE